LTLRWPSPLFREFFFFSAIGAAAFLLDAAILTLLVRTTGIGLYGGRAISFLCAATFTWLMNRSFTFRRATSDGGAHRWDDSWLSQWLRFLGANAVGGLVNLGVYTWLVSVFASVAHQPVIAVGAGSIAGLLFNFSLSKKFVFRSPHKR
jgi:putative flippase GtrA